MKPTDLETAFVKAAVRRLELLFHDPAGANREFDKLHNLKDEMRLLPDKGRAILCHITGHDNPRVRLSAAAALLAVDEAYAIGVLEQIAQTDADPALDAKLTIREWKNGNLRDYWR